MKVTLGHKETKELFKEALAELMEERRDFFLDVVWEAIEEIGLANAIREGRQNELVGTDQISAILAVNDKASPKPV